jgi:hypothetical protein
MVFFKTILYFQAHFIPTNGIDENELLYLCIAFLNITESLAKIY